MPDWHLVFFFSDLSGELTINLIRYIQLYNQTLLVVSEPEPRSVSILKIVRFSVSY